MNISTCTTIIKMNNFIQMGFRRKSNDYLQICIPNFKSVSLVFSKPDQKDTQYDILSLIVTLTLSTGILLL